MQKFHPFLSAISIAIVLLGCGASDSSSFTLYRNSILDENMWIHVATFDAKDGDKYNKENCDQAQELFQNQLAVKTKFWCEKGSFRK